MDTGDLGDATDFQFNALQDLSSLDFRVLVADIQYLHVALVTLDLSKFKSTSFCLNPEA